MRILICDDEDAFCKHLRSLIEEYFKKISSREYEIVEYNSGEMLLADTGKKDLVFLDIEMPGQDGIFVGNKLKEKNPKTLVIVVTSFTEYLDDAMKFSVFRYINKPVDKQRLHRNLKDAIEAYSTRNIFLGIETKDGYIKLDSDDVIMIESKGRKLHLFTKTLTYELSGTLSDWNDKLSAPCFFMSHRSYIINIKHISHIGRDIIELNDGKYQAYLTKRKYVELKNKFMLYLETLR